MNSRNTLFFLFVLSGMSGLIYQSVWTHYIKLILGHSAYSQTLVLCIFMGGMAFGAWLVSRFIDRIQSSLLFYAIVEVLIGFFGFIFHQEFLLFESVLFNQLIPSLSDETSINAVKWLGSGAILLPQSILLGMTFPLMSSALVRMDPDRSGNSLGMLYFSNSIGAAIGVLLSGFFIIENFGLNGANTIAATLNVILALFLWLLSKRVDSTNVRFVKQFVERGFNTGTKSQVYLLLAVSFFTGCASFFYEIAWIRALSLVLGSSVQSFELMLCAFISGLAFGGLYIRNKIETYKNPRQLLGIVQCLMGLAAVMTLPLYVYSFEIMSFLINALQQSAQGYWVYIVGGQIICFLVMFPAAFLAGMTLPLITNILLESPEGEAAIGKVYALNTVGAIVGVFFAIHMILPIFGLKNLLIFGGLIDVILGLYLLNVHKNFSRMQFAVPVAGLLVLFVSFSSVKFSHEILASGVFRHGFSYLENNAILFYKDGKTSTVAVVETEGFSKSILTNGKADASIYVGDEPSPDEITMVFLGAMALATKPDAEEVANIGIGSGLTSHVLLASDNLKNLDTIEIEKEMVSGARFFSPVNDRVFSDPRSNIVIDDAKSYFSTSGKKYDIVASVPSNPWVSGVASLFTDEFYSRVKKSMQDDGIFAQWIQLYEMDIKSFASIIKALNKNFTSYHVYSTSDKDLVVLASDKHNLELEDENFERMFSFEKLKPSLERMKTNRKEGFHIRFIGDKAMLEGLFEAQKAPMNSDYFPYLAYKAPKARFLKSSAQSISELHHEPIPLLRWLTGREKYLTNFDYAKDETFSYYHYARRANEIVSNSGNDQTPNNLEIFRFTVKNCGKGVSDESYLFALSNLASEINPYLAPEKLSAFWQPIKSRCTKLGMSKYRMQWLKFYYQVSQSDFSSIKDVSGDLLQIDSISSRSAVKDLHLAFLASSLMLKDFEGVRELLNSESFIDYLVSYPTVYQLLVSLLPPGELFAPIQNTP